MLPQLLDAITVGLVRLVVGCVVLRFGHRATKQETRFPMNRRARTRISLKPKPTHNPPHSTYKSEKSSRYGTLVCIYPFWRGAPSLLSHWLPIAAMEACKGHCNRPQLRHTSDGRERRERKREEECQDIPLPSCWRDGVDLFEKHGSFA